MLQLFLWFFTKPCSRSNRVYAAWLFHTHYHFCCSWQITTCGRSTVRCPLTSVPAVSTIITTFASSSER